MFKSVSFIAAVGCILLAGACGEHHHDAPQAAGSTYVPTDKQMSAFVHDLNAQGIPVNEAKVGQLRDIICPIVSADLTDDLRVNLAAAFNLLSPAVDPGQASVPPLDPHSDHIDTIYKYARKDLCAQ